MQEFAVVGTPDQVAAHVAQKVLPQGIGGVVVNMPFTGHLPGTVQAIGEALALSCACNVIYVPVSDLAPDQVCLAVAAARVSPVGDDFLAAAQTTAEITAECGNNEMWQLGGGGVSQPG